MAAFEAAAFEGQPPPELIWWWAIQRYGNPTPGVSWLNWPAGLSRRVTKLANIYQFAHGWANASNRTAWTENNPDQWEIVSALISRRRELKEAGDYDSEYAGHSWRSLPRPGSF